MQITGLHSRPTQSDSRGLGPGGPGPRNQHADELCRELPCPARFEKSPGEQVFVPAHAYLQSTVWARRKGEQELRRRGRGCSFSRGWYAVTRHLCPSLRSAGLELSYQKCGQWNSLCPSLSSEDEPRGLTPEKFQDKMIDPVVWNLSLNFFFWQSILLIPIFLKNQKFGSRPVFLPHHPH